MLLKIDSGTLLMIGSTNVTHISVHIYVYINLCMYVEYACYICMLCMYMHCYSNWLHKHYLNLVPQALPKINSQVVLQINLQALLKVDTQTLLKIVSTSVTQNYFHKFYSKESTNVTQNRSTNVTGNWFCNYYSKQIHKLYSK